MNQQLRLPNHQKELLDTWIEGNPHSQRLILLVHGFGTDKHEHGLFDALVDALSDNFLTVRFDFSGYGQSQGKQQDVTYTKQVKDLQAVLNWIDQTYPDIEKNILAMSMGCYVVSLLKPKNIEKTVLLSIPDQTTATLKQVIQNRILQKGGTVNQSGISTYPRTHGETQKIGPQFWQDMDHLDPIKEIQKLADQTKLLIIHPQDDEIVATQNIQAYKNIKSPHYLELAGNHSWTNIHDRNHLLNNITKFIL